MSKEQKIVIITNSSEETKKLGGEIGALLKAGDIIGLFGNLGAGKTCLTQGIVRGLKADESEYVTSPTYTIINEYQGYLPIYHIDLYRLNNSNEIYDLGYEEYLFGSGVTIIEWAEKMSDLLPEEYLKIELSTLGENKRKITILAVGKECLSVVKGLEGNIV